MSLVLIVRGEEELGLQRFCPGCRSWWPDTHEYFATWGGWRHGRCRACETALRAAAAARRQCEIDATRQEVRRATWRRQQAAWRARQAGAVG